MINKVILIGNVGADPEVNKLENGTMVANLRLATTESYKNKSGERVDRTEWHSIVLWSGLAEIVAKYVHKGMRLYIEGRLRSRGWEDDRGIKHHITEIHASTLQMLSYPKENQDDLPNVSIPQEADDIPF